MIEIVFAVDGVPVPQGALVRSPQGFLYNRGGPKLNRWRKAIADAAHQAMTTDVLEDGPVSVAVTFVVHRPDSHYLPANSRRSVRMLREGSPIWSTSAPDIDKLTRACLDALTGVVWIDDAQVARIQVWKRYEDGMGAVGAQVRVSSMPVTA